jgi:hypothetical protein
MGEEEGVPHVHETLKKGKLTVVQRKNDEKRVHGMVRYPVEKMQAHDVGRYFDARGMGAWRERECGFEDGLSVCVGMEDRVLKVRGSLR